MERKVELFGSTISVESILAISQKSRRFLWIIVWIKRLFYILLIASAYLIIFPLYSFTVGNALYWLIIPIGLFFFTETLVDMIWKPDERKIILNLSNGTKILSNYINKREIHEYIKSANTFIDNAKK